MIRALFVALLFLCIPAGYKSMTQGFRLGKLQLAPPGRVENVDSLDQSFSYLARGMQSYVFQSSDQKTVLKIFKKAPTFNRFQKTIAACKLALELGQKETGLLFFHLTSDPDLKIPVVLKDRLGLPHAVDLNQYCFCLQKKIEPFETALLEVLREKKGAPLLDSYLELIASRVSKGIANTDSRLFKNFGVIGDQVFEIDFGNYEKSVEDPFFEYFKCTGKMREFLLKKSPETVPFYDEKVEECYSRFFGEKK